MRKLALLAVGLSASGGEGGAGCRGPTSSPGRLRAGPCRSTARRRSTGSDRSSWRDRRPAAPVRVGREPTLHETYESLPASAKGKGGKSFRATVPVWFHVISDGSAAVSRKGRSTIRSASSTSASQASMAGRSRASRSARRCHPNGQRDVVQRPGGRRRRAGHEAPLHRGGFETLNVYSNLAGGYLGYAYLPGLPDSRLYMDGIV